MRALVVGGGFIGCAIANQLISDGHTVRVLSPSRRGELSAEAEFVSARLEIGVELDAHLSGCGIVIDAASSMIPASVQESPAASFVSGVGATSWLAERAAALQVPQLLFLSSGGTVYGENSQSSPHSESDPLQPSSAYGALKASCELCVRGATSGTATRAVMLRVANAYGPHQNLRRPQGIVGVAFANALAGRTTTLFGAHEVMRDLIHVRDVAMLVSHIAGQSLEGPLNVGSGKGIRLDDLVSLLGDTIGRPLTIDHQARRPFDVAHSVLDISRARDLGWAPSIGLRQGLEETWRWISTERPS